MTLLGRLLDWMGKRFPDTMPLDVMIVKGRGRGMTCSVTDEKRGEGEGLPGARSKTSSQET